LNNANNGKNQIVKKQKWRCILSKDNIDDSYVIHKGNFMECYSSHPIHSSYIYVLPPIILNRNACLDYRLPNRLPMWNKWI